MLVNQQPRTRRPRALAVALTSLLVVGAAACSDDTNDAVTTTVAPTTTTGTTEPAATTTVAMPVGDVVATALTNHVFTELAGLVVDAGLVDALRDPAGFTVFAPTDSAFAKLPDDVLHAVQDATDSNGEHAMLKTVLLHHVVSGSIPELKAGELTTLAGDKLTITKVGDSFYADGAKVGAGVAASNGTVYVMGDVLVPALGDIPTIAQTLPGFSTLVSLVVKANLVDTLSGTGPFTVFAPLDSAFEALPTATVNAVTSDSALLKKVLTHHVVAGKITLDQLTDGQKLTTVAGDQLTVSVDEQGNVSVDGVPVAVGNVQATNGVIHVIGSVLVPAS